MLPKLVSPIAGSLFSLSFGVPHPNHAGLDFVWIAWTLRHWVLHRALSRLHAHKKLARVLSRSRASSIAPALALYLNICFLNGFVTPSSTRYLKYKGLWAAEVIHLVECLHSFSPYNVQKASLCCCSYFAKSHLELQSLFGSCCPPTLTLVTSDPHLLPALWVSGVPETLPHTLDFRHGGIGDREGSPTVPGVPNSHSTVGPGAIYSAPTYLADVCSLLSFCPLLLESALWTESFLALLSVASVCLLN